jgi:hypothetical protein
MSETLDISDEEMLSRLAACDLSAAERVHSRLMAAEETADIAELGRTYQRIARSLRQTLALKARFKREREAADKGARPVKAGGVEVAQRVRAVRAAVARVIWNEAEGEEAADHEEDLDDKLSVEILMSGFCAEPLDDQVARICLEMELSAEAALRWRELPDPPGSDDPPDPPPGDGPDFDSSD